jgi:hypothetical protein
MLMVASPFVEYLVGENHLFKYLRKTFFWNTEKIKRHERFYRPWHFLRMLW